jgi:hypothetical protein
VQVAGDSRARQAALLLCPWLVLLLVFVTFTWCLAVLPAMSLHASWQDRVVSLQASHTPALQMQHVTVPASVCSGVRILCETLV